jgi:hypothetical protein
MFLNNTQMLNLLDFSRKECTASNILKLVLKVPPWTPHISISIVTFFKG